MASRLQGRNILLVGAAGKLGPAWAEGILNEGATVLALGPDVLKDRELEQLAARSPGKMLLGHGDVTTSLSSDDLASAFGGDAGTRTIHGVVYNAGIDSPAGTSTQDAINFEASVWDQVFRVNVFGFANILTAVTPLLAGSSSIVAIGSMYGIVSPRKDL